MRSDSAAWERAAEVRGPAEDWLRVGTIETGIAAYIDWLRTHLASPPRRA